MMGGAIALPGRGRRVAVRSSSQASPVLRPCRRLAPLLIRLCIRSGREVSIGGGVVEGSSGGVVVVEVNRGVKHYCVRSN